MNKVSEFIAGLPYMKGLGFDTFAIYTQAYLETGNFTCRLSPVNNFTGMMPRPDCPYPSQKFWTHEYEHGVKVDRFSEFNVYPTVHDYFVDYNNMVSKKFPIAYKERGDYQKYFKGIMTYDKNGDIIYPSFCTAKGYENKLIDLYDYLNKNTHYELKVMI